MIHQAMLMAAGLGTRLRPFTNLRTKALTPVMGIPVAQFAIDSLLEFGVSKIVANYHHLGDQAVSGLRGLHIWKAKLQLSDETSELLGSAGGIRKALPEFGNQPFFLANADVLCEMNWKELARFHAFMRKKEGVWLTLAVRPQGPTGGVYREILFDSATGLMTQLGELGVGKPFFNGAAVLEPEAFKSVPLTGPADFVQTILIPALQQKKVAIFFVDGAWYDMGSPELWLKTHLGLIESLETGSLTSDVGRCWRRRIEEKNLRLGSGIWISRLSPRPRIISRWNAPCYWDAEDSVGSPPMDLGPEAVLYGKAQISYRNGIGLGGEWVSFRSVDNRTINMKN